MLCAGLTWACSKQEDDFIAPPPIKKVVVIVKEPVVVVPTCVSKLGSKEEDTNILFYGLFKTTRRTFNIDGGSTNWAIVNKETYNTYEAGDCLDNVNYTLTTDESPDEIVDAVESEGILFDGWFLRGGYRNTFKNGTQDDLNADGQWSIRNQRATYFYKGNENVAEYTYHKVEDGAIVKSIRVFTNNSSHNIGLDNFFLSSNAKRIVEVEIPSNQFVDRDGSTYKIKYYGPGLITYTQGDTQREGELYFENEYFLTRQGPQEWVKSNAVPLDRRVDDSRFDYGQNGYANNDIHINSVNGSGVSFGTTNTPFTGGTFSGGGFTLSQYLYSPNGANGGDIQVVVEYKTSGSDGWKVLKGPYTATSKYLYGTYNTSWNTGLIITNIYPKQLEIIGDYNQVAVRFSLGINNIKSNYIIRGL